MNYDQFGSDYILTDKDFLFFKEKIFDLSGIYLADNKRDLIHSRIRSYMQKNGLDSFSTYRKIIEHAEKSSPAIQNFINLLTTNKTDFFREEKHFDFLVSKLIPRWLDQGKKKINIWCCASSTGEEPYTLAMVLDHHLPVTIDFQILASDIDTEVLSKAKNGVYSMDKIYEIPEEYQDKYLSVGSGTARGHFRIKDNIHSKVIFKQHNLMDSARPGDEVMDLIFCRNVIIYFSQENILILMNKIHQTLKKDGVLFLGHSESIHGVQQLYKPLQPSVFAKVK